MGPHNAGVLNVSCIAWGGGGGGGGGGGQELRKGLGFYFFAYPLVRHIGFH